MQDRMLNIKVIKNIQIKPCRQAVERMMGTLGLGGDPEKFLEEVAN